MFLLTKSDRRLLKAACRIKKSGYFNTCLTKTDATTAAFSILQHITHHTKGEHCPLHFVKMIDFSLLREQSGFSLVRISKFLIVSRLQ